MATSEPVTLPVGFERFHKKQFVNYQLNRAHSLGYSAGETRSPTPRRA